jgi:ssDNA-binding Zn-finger/Zn-ribbon topoisomerase 1
MTNNNSCPACGQPLYIRFGDEGKYHYCINCKQRYVETFYLEKTIVFINNKEVIKSASNNLIPDQELKEFVSNN